MKIEVEVTDGQYCDGCIFIQTPRAMSTSCLLLKHKSLHRNPHVEIINGVNHWVEHTIKDKDCPSFYFQNT